MPFSSQHVLMRIEGFFGTLATPAEHWMCTLRINTGSTGNTEAAKVSFLETASVPVQAFHTSSSTAAGMNCYLEQISAAYIGTDGHYVGGGAQTTTIRPYPSPVAGTSANLMSWDVARVYTLRTAQARGRGHVGRFYYPCQATISTDGRWDATQTNGAATAAKSLLDNINAAAKSVWTASFGISVMSFVGGVSYQVNAVEVGRAPDTQRRRTKSLEEAPSRALIAGVLTTEEVNLGRVWS